MTGLRGGAGIAAGALIVLAGLAAPATVTTASSAATAPVPGTGVDVSSLQHPGSPPAAINWQQVAAAGKTFVGIKASEGNYYKNPDYQADAAAAAAAGLYVMPYVFANPYHTNGTAAGQADYAWDNEISKVTSPSYLSSGLMLPMAVDLEPDPYVNSETNSNQCYGLTPSAMRTWIQQFLTEAKNKTNKTPVIYTTASWWSACVGATTAFAGYPLWLASYGVSNPALPPGWNNVTFWQYTDSGTVTGIAGTTDVDYLGPVLQVSQAGQAIAPVQLRTLNGLNGQTVSFTPATVLPGVSVNSAGQITGTPATSAIGQHTVTVQTASAGAAPATMQFTWDVHGALAVKSPGNRATIAGSPVWLRVTASDQDGASFPPAFTASGLPPGLSINSIGQITGWPSHPGTYTGKVSATDGLYAAGSVTFTWTVNAAANAGTAGPVRQLGGTGKCLNDPGASTKNGTVINLWTCTGKSNQRWTVVQDGTLRVLGKCLGVVGDSKTSGARLQLVTCNSRDGGQLWQSASNAQLLNPQSGKCIDVPAASAANGTKPVIEPCANSTTQPNEHWLRPAAPIVSGVPGKCLAVSGSPAVPAGCANTAAQHWQSYPDGTIRLAGKCLTEGGTAAGSVLWIGTCSGSAATKWKLVPYGPIAVKIASAASGLCLTVPASGSRMVMAACAATPAGTWHVE